MDERDWPQRQAFLMGPWEVITWWQPVHGSPQVVGVDIRSFHSSKDGRPGPAPDWVQLGQPVEGTVAGVPVATTYYAGEEPREFTGLEPIDGEALAVITKALLRGLPWESIRETTRRYLRWSAVGEESLAVDPAAKARARDRAKALREPMRASYPPEHWEDVARVYNGAVARGDRHPTAAVRDQLIPARVERDRAKARTTAANWVRKARQLDLIDPDRRKQ
ncbi:hypothetical protein [Nocardioides piscis]|uniref:Uncharacterized protein n=1 Tax=Nocardioides piscis TaxID=2714938 RepID=A0A6G7YGU3_9ACTN|nr:hypothetical protein [Nocardioides piscis]QIK76035.1 hypothetical protein G7071_11925 [Nocardioides piscis]